MAYLRQKGISSEQFCYYQDIGMRQLIEKILDKKPKVIGFTCYDRNYFLIKAIARYIKSSNPDLLILTGGPTATFSDKVILKNIPEVDLCVRGEGEYTTYEILSQLRSGRYFNNISGITYRCGNKLIRTKDRALINDDGKKGSELDIMPSPYLSGIIDPYEMLKNKDELSITTSRGCIYKCTYCNFSAMSRHTIRYHSVERIIQELKMINELSKHKDNFLVRFHDDNFTFDNKRVEQICDRIIKEKIVLNIGILTRGDYVNKRILTLLFKAGVREISFGLESAVPRVLYNIKKVRFFYASKDYFRPEKRYLQKVKESVGMAKKIGFKVYVSVIFGLPGETLKDGLKTIDFVKKLSLNGYYHNLLYIYAGTELYNKFSRNKSEVSESRFKQLSRIPQSPPFLYDIFKVPICKNVAGLLRITMPVLLAMSSSLMGFYEDDGKDARILDVILANRKFPTEWLINNCSFQSRIIFSNSIKGLPIQRDGRLKINVLTLVEILNNRPTDLESIYRKIPGGDYRFKKYSFFPEFIKKPTGPEDVIFDISDTEDLDGFENLFSKGTISSCESQAGSKFGYILLDSCRWLDFCQATRLKRIIIDQHNNILPCFHGKIIGKVGDDLEKIQKNIIAYRKEEGKKRGCDKCPVRHNCSQCPFLGHLDSKRYCEIKKKYSSLIGKFINLLQFKKAIKIQLALDNPSQ